MKVLDLPTRDILAVHFGLIFDKELKFGLGGRVSLEVDLEAMSRLYRTVGGGIERPLDMGILGIMDCGQ